MKKLIFSVVICATPLAADPLDLNDYPAIFSENADAVEQVSSTRKNLEMADVTLIQDPTEMREYTGVDVSGQGAVGCFVSILATIESAVSACEVSLPEDQIAQQSAYKSIVFEYYARNVQPATDVGTVSKRFDALVESQIEGAKPLCSNIDLVTSLADRLFSKAGEAEMTRMLSQPRLPVANPCL